jgi:hypothetical protein
MKANQSRKPDASRQSRRTPLVTFSKPAFLPLCHVAVFFSHSQFVRSYSFSLSLHGISLPIPVNKGIVEIVSLRSETTVAHLFLSTSIIR